MRRFVRLTHLATGDFVEVDWYGANTKSLHSMSLKAWRIMRAREYARAKGLYPVSEFDRVRTYHTSPYGTFTKEHRSGVRVDGAFLELRERTEDE